MAELWSLMSEPGSAGGLTVERTARIGGLQSIAIPLAAVPLMVLVPPTEAIGDAGWPIALGGIALVVAIGVGLARRPDVTEGLLAASNATVVATIALITWLSGGFQTPVPVALIIAAASLAPFQPSTRAKLLGFIALAALSPLIYAERTGTYVAEAIAIVIAAAGVMATMIWLSARVRATEDLLSGAAARARNAATAAEARAETLRQLDTLRDRFVATVSHELRTPLTSIKGYLEALQDEEVGDLNSEQREFTSIAMRNAVRLEAMIEDLLVLAGIEAGQLSVKFAEFDLAATVSGVVDQLAPTASAKAVHVRLASPLELRLVGDRPRIEQAVGNLLLNAIKYSPSDSRVSVEVVSGAEEITVAVADNGVGIPADEIERVGERFFRASTAGQENGTGLGLAISREIAELHGGALAVSSEEGRGSTFRLVLPANGGH